jgi:cytochrome c biogenesis protein CcmG/thiol:disulfide interchange protein DsbE
LKKGIIFLAVLVPIVALLYFSLTRNPRTLPSALIGKPAPAFELTTLEGEKISLTSLRGKPVVLNFWSTWCGPCIAEHQLIRQAVRAYAPAGVLFYSILYEDTPENAGRFIAEFGKGAPVLLDPGLKTAIDYGVAGVPETFFINREGTVVSKYAGALTPEILDNQLRILVSVTQ